MSPSSPTRPTSATATWRARLITTPVFGVEVPLVLHELAEPDKGTGIAMICTFGDTTDVTWWRELDLPARPVLGRNGRFTDEVPDVITGDGAERYAAIVGKTVHTAKEIIVEQLRASDQLIGDPESITHPVKFFEKGDKPLEIITHPPVVHPQRRPRRRTGRGPDRTGREDRLPPRLHADPLSELDRGAAR